MYIILCMEYKIKYVGSNLRTDWSIYYNATMETISKEYFYTLIGISDFDPIDACLFNLDIFTYTDKVHILHSSIRCVPNIPCILYGNRARPDDERLPDFVIESAECSIPEYVIISYKDWEPHSSPSAHIVKRIGVIQEPRHFYEYYLYSKSLQFSPTINTKHLFSQILSVKSYKIEDRTREYVITIDPKKSKDFDDGMAFQQLNKTSRFTIYISNVALWIDFLNLWEALSYRMRNIHLPDRKRPLMPFVLSDGLFSLKQNELRIALAIDMYITDGEIKSVVYKNALIRVSRNYHYNEEGLNDDPIYNDVFKLITVLFKQRTFKNIDYMRDSHDMICYIMLLANTTIAREFIKYECGLFRSENPVPSMTAIGEKMREEHSLRFRKLIYNWNMAGSCFRPYKERVKHSLLKLEHYIQVTSPIRRLVDLLNMMMFQISSKWIRRGFMSNAFMDYWMTQVEYINQTLRSVRRVQNSIHIIERYREIPNDKSFRGYMFDIITRNDGLHQYMVYLEELNVLARYLSNVKRNEYETGMFRIYICRNPVNGRDKIMVSDASKFC